MLIHSLRLNVRLNFTLPQFVMTHHQNTKSRKETTSTILYNVERVEYHLLILALDDSLECANGMIIHLNFKFKFYFVVSTEFFF